MKQNQPEIISTLRNYLRVKFGAEGTGHDWFHIERVFNNAISIAKKEKGVNLFIVKLGALLHDIADFKFHGGDEKKGGRIAAKLLRKFGVDEGSIERVVHIVDEVSFKGAGVKLKMKSLEGKIVQDADRLDAIGAIGIARAFAYGGFKGKPIYNPTGKARAHRSLEAYKKGSDSTIHHFYEKLLHLRKLMNTKIGRKMASERHKFLKDYLKQFYAEWRGIK